jgi:hypothetical protein
MKITGIVGAKSKSNVCKSALPKVALSKITDIEIAIGKFTVPKIRFCEIDVSQFNVFEY